ncbi:MAG: glycoside hydrolase family 92 protein [Ruminococcaceae bacterium]|nr:glycoside hydrolase family 92 protein [Oscillospiraceae bacterium]
MSKAKYVDTSIGTVAEEDSIEECHGGGKTYPGASVPGGMVQLSPDTITGGDNGNGYNYCHNTIEGFSFNHMSGIGWYGDLGNLQIMPVINETDLRSGSNEHLEFKKGTRGWKSEFSHDSEITEAGYYSVKLDRYNILAEVTANVHTGMLRFTYPEKEQAKIIMNFSRRIGGKADFEEIKIVNESTIEGKIKCTPKGGGFGHGHGKISYDFYFTCELSKKPLKTQFFSDEELQSENLKEFSHEDVGLILDYGDSVTEPIILKCGISYTSLDGARKNLKAEMTDFDFEKQRQNSRDLWEKAFSIVDVEGSNETDLKLFYTCLYHVLLDPRVSADIDGSFSLNGENLKDNNYTHRTVFSGWDVYRSEFPLLAIIRPDIVNDEVNSLLKIAEVNNSSFPRWELLGINAGCMVGDPGAIVVADAYLKNIRNYDTDKAYKIGVASTKCEKELFNKQFHSIRPDCEQYLNEAYVPEKLSDTLEYLLADYTMYLFSKEKGDKENEEYFLNRVKTYKDNFNKNLGFLSPRKADGEFVFEENEYDDDGCVESNIFQQSWFVPYDVTGLCELFGKERALVLLERFFEKADFGRLWNDDYNHSNEPCHNITHYFDILGLAHRTQYWTRRVQKEAYRTGAYGFCGNEDVGQLSAWYVLSALGFAQVCPGVQDYFINTPLFKKATVKLNKEYHSCVNAETFTVECDKDPLEYPYISKIKFNGKLIKKPYLSYFEITSGGILKFELSKEPVTDYFEKTEK